MMNLQQLLNAGLVGRDASSLTEEQWERVDMEVTETLQRLTIARMALAPILDVTNEGPGVKQLKRYKEGDSHEASIDVRGKPKIQDVPDLTEELDRTVVIHDGYELDWRDVASSQRNGTALDVRAIRMATKKVALKEDEFAQLGSTKYGIDGFLDPTGALTQAAVGGGFDTEGAAFKTIDAAILQAEEAGVRVRAENTRVFLNADQLGELRAPFSGRSGNGLTDLIESGMLGPDSVHHAPLQTAGVGTVVFLDPAYQTWNVTVDTRAEELPMIDKDPRGWVYGIHGLQHHEPQATVKLTGI